MPQKVASLVDRDMLARTPIEGSDGDHWVEITDEGREAHARALDQIGPEVAQFLEGIDMEDLKIAHRVIQDIRRTLDNLPDR